jgi:hypothetical protein
MLLGLGCGGAAVPTTPTTPAAETPAAPSAEPEKPTDPSATPATTSAALELWDDLAPEAIAAPQRGPGDFVVYRFSGNYRKSPVTVSQRVVERRDQTLVVDVSVEEEGKTEQLRVRVRNVAGEPDEIVSVARLIDGVQRPFGIEAYEKLMAKTMMPVDQNDALLSSEPGAVKVGDKSFDCLKSAFRIHTGDAVATMTTFEGKGFAWGDLGGQIVAADGTLLYKAEVVEFGGPAAKGGLVAAHEAEEESDGYDE